MPERLPAAGALGLLLVLWAGPLGAEPARAQGPVEDAGLGGADDLLDPATRQHVQTARAAEAAGDWRRAGTAWRLVLSRDPVYVPAVLGLARAQAGMGRPDAAAATLGRLPADPDAVEALAALVEEEDPARAAELYGRLATLRLGDPEPLRLQVGALVRVDPQAAAERLDLWLGMVSGEPDGALILDVAVALKDAGDGEAARALLERYLAGWPEGSHAEEARGRLDRLAVETAARELAVGASQPLTPALRTRVEGARKRAAAGQAEPALAELREVVQEAPRSAEAWGALGDVHVLLDRVDEAERAWTWATALAPEEATWHARLGLLLAERYGGRRHREADELLSRALALRPGQVELRYRQGRVRQELGEWERAASAYEAYLQAEPDGPFAADARQRVADLRRTVPAAMEMPRRSAAEPAELPEEAVEHYRIARVYWDQGQLEESRAELDLALAAAPDWAAALNLLAALEMHAGDEAAAVSAWERSLASDPAQPLVRLNLGQRLRREGDLDRAAELLQQAAEGGAEDAWYLLAELAWEDHRLFEAQRLLDRYFEVSTGGISQEAAHTLRDRVQARIRLLRGGAAGALGVSVLGLSAIAWRRSRGRTLDDLVAAAPESTHDLARLLSAIRHEVLKHNTTLLDEVAAALEHGDHAAVRFAALRLFGDPSAGRRGQGEEAEGVVHRFAAYLRSIEALGRRHGVRLDLRRKDPVLAPMAESMRRLRRLERTLRSPRSAGDAVPAELRALSVQLNDEAYRALGRLLRRMGTLVVDRRLLAAVDARVRDEPALAGEQLPPLHLDVPAPVPVKVFQGDLEDIVANLLRNAYRAVSEDLGPGLRSVGLSLHEDDDPITGLEHAVLAFHDNAPGRLTDAMIRGRSIGRGLGLAVDLITRHDGSITVVPARGADAARWTKAVVVRLPRAEADPDDGGHDEDLPELP